jgi:antiviral defense system Shedu protein SduA
MDVRADWALELQLEQVEEHAVDQSVKGCVHRALEHMASGKDHHRRGGSELVALLAEARQRAADYDEWPVVRLLQDSIDYAEGRILQPVLEEQYRLFQDGLRSENKRKFVANMASTALLFVAEAGSEYLAEHPGATLRELLEHIESLSRDAAFIEAPEDRPGRYRIPRGRAETTIWIERVLRNRIDIEDARAEARRLAMSPQALAALAADADGQTLLRALELQWRAEGLVALRRVVEDPQATEHQLQKALSGHYWIFGGRYVGDETAYRRLVPGDEYDIPLVRADGALQIVELKLAMRLGSPLIKRHRGSWVAASAVNDAISQALFYLIGLDEHRLRIRDEMGVETRRASAIVLIGHPAAQPEVPEEAVYETFRTLNTHLARVEVLTYKELVDNAERSIGGAAKGPGSAY